MQFNKMAYVIHEDHNSINEDDAVQVNGVQFKVFMPKRILQMPAEQLGAMIDVELGIQITNNTSNPLNFCFFNALTPELMIDQQIFRLKDRWSDWYRWDLFDDDFALAQPGETVTFLTDALITTTKGEIFDLKIHLEMVVIGYLVDSLVYVHSKNIEFGFSMKMRSTKPK